MFRTVAVPAQRVGSAMRGTPRIGDIRVASCLPASAYPALKREAVAATDADLGPVVIRAA